MEKRNINCDILRILAFSFVVAVHSISYLGFYKTVTEGPIMLMLNIIRCLFMTCVPLFIILTGYLSINKELNKDYFKKIYRIILTYILCSIACLIALHFIETRPVLSLKDCIFSILSFNAAPYSWYVNMYIGLFLIIPFLNILWKSLKSKKNKQYLLIVLILLFVIPTLTNIYNFNNIDWWIHPAISKSYQQIMPNYWLGGGYPILYYYIGCYLKEYKLNISVIKNILALLFFMIVFGAFNYYRNYNNLFDWGIYSGYYSFEVFIISTLFANLLLKNFKINIKNKLALKLIPKISYLTFGAYLLSKIFDSLIYSKVFNHTSYIKERLLYWSPIVFVIILCSLLLSYLIDIIQRILNKLFQLIKSGLLKNGSK